MPNKKLQAFIFTTVLFGSGFTSCRSSESVTHYNFSSINSTSLGSPFSTGGYNANAMTGMDKGAMGQPFKQTNTDSPSTAGGYVGFNFSTINKDGAAFSHAFAPEHTDVSPQPQASLSVQNGTPAQQNIPSPFVGTPKSFTQVHASTPPVHKSFQDGEIQDLQPAPAGVADTTFNGTSER